MGIIWIELYSSAVVGNGFVILFVIIFRLSAADMPIRIIWIERYSSAVVGNGFVMLVAILGIEAPVLRINECARHIPCILDGEFQPQALCPIAIVADADGEHMQPRARCLRPTDR